jgi:hypothetical protein
MMDKLEWETWPNNCLRHSWDAHAAHFAIWHPTADGSRELSLTHYCGRSDALREPAAWWAL